MIKRKFLFNLGTTTTTAEPVLTKDLRVNDGLIASVTNDTLANALKKSESDRTPEENQLVSDFNNQIAAKVTFIFYFTKLFFS